MCGATCVVSVLVIGFVLCFMYGVCGVCVRHVVCVFICVSVCAVRLRDVECVCEYLCDSLRE